MYKLTHPHEGAEDAPQDLCNYIQAPLGPGCVASQAGCKGDCWVQVTSRYIGCDVHCNQRYHVSVCKWLLTQYAVWYMCLEESRLQVKAQPGAG